jgi:hypothetical protein
MFMCAVCTQASATMYCVNDDAYLCAVCDQEHHENPLGAKHERRPISEFGAPREEMSGTSLDAAVVPQLPHDDFLMLSGDFDLIGGFDNDLFTIPDNFDPLMTGLSDVEGHDDLMVPQVPEPQALMVPQQPVEPQVMMVPQHVNIIEEEDVLVPNMHVELIDCDEEKIQAPVQEKKRRTKTYDDYDYSFFEDDDDEEKEEDTDFYVAPRRTSAGTRRASRRSQYSAHVSSSIVSHASDEPELTREERVARYLAKRARRSFQKTIRYQSRKAYAEIRPRIKGRFVSHEEYAEYMATQKQQVEQVVPSC